MATNGRKMDAVATSHEAKAAMGNYDESTWALEATLTSPMQQVWHRTTAM